MKPGASTAVDQVAPEDIRASAQSLIAMVTLGFGSFVDKVVMPYVSTVPRK